MKDKETKCEYCEKIHPDWFACSKYVDLIVRSAPINAAPLETKKNGLIGKLEGVKVGNPPETKEECDCGHPGGEGVTHSKGICIKIVSAPPETSSWEEEFDKQFKDSFSGGDMHSWARAEPIKDFIRSVASSEYKRGYRQGIKDGRIDPDMQRLF